MSKLILLVKRVPRLLTKTRMLNSNNKKNWLKKSLYVKTKRLLLLQKLFGFTNCKQTQSIFKVFDFGWRAF